MMCRNRALCLGRTKSQKFMRHRPGIPVCCACGVCTVCLVLAHGYYEENWLVLDVLKKGDRLLSVDHRRRSTITWQC